MTVATTHSRRTVTLPEHRELYYGGRWMPALSGETRETINPATGESFCTVAYGGAADMDAAIEAAHAAFPAWRDTAPLERARCLRKIADIMRANRDALALIDAADSGNPVTAMARDIDIATSQLDFFAGLVTEMKGDTIPMGPEILNLTVREPVGVVGRIVAYNHPLMFCAAKMAAPLAAGNTVVIKPAELAPLSVLRFVELIEGVLPPGVFNMVHGGVEAGQRLASHGRIAKVGLIGSVATGRAVMRAASDTLKGVMLELGGKNALIGCPDADVERTARGVVAGMNFAWCGQSCGSTSRAFLHEDIHDAVLARVAELCADFTPGDPTDPATNMGALASKAAQEKTLRYIATARREGARLVCGGRVPDVPGLRSGFFVEPTVFADVTPDMTIAREEIFGPVLSVLKWRDEAAMMEAVNAVEFGLTCAIFTKDLAGAHRLARQAEAGFVWVNKAGPHFLGAPFGGVKQSGIGREECIGEMLDFTREKNIHIALD
ncbi:aldehyde dehydrogenase family protein [Aurantimonas coralicida]|uniref:aldehyde dehydrogenase family protein n=1 Tax=Aurantimonas coralicida TaxID=182270 RepID=UPI00238F3142|nr:aldehyde dehydrogenase family protein [Aurantimonas coralicida]MDE0923787.1 aldehyde dehydrogenase family protein [Aurantimonas coralicida]